MEIWWLAILGQQIYLSITVSTVQLPQHYHPEPPLARKRIPSPTVTSKIFPPSITFTRAPAGQVMLGTSHGRAFPAAHNPDEQSPGAARGSCGVTDQAGCKDWIWKSLRRAGRDKVRKQFTIFLLVSEWHNPSFSAICCLLSGNCTTSLPHITAANHHWVEKERYRNTACRQHYSRLRLRYTLPSNQQATVCLVSRAPSAHLNGSNNGDSMRSPKGSNQGYTVKTFERQLKSACWS